LHDTWHAASVSSSLIFPSSSRSLARSRIARSANGIPATARTYPRHGARLRHLPIIAVFPLRVAGPRVFDWPAWLRARIRSRFLIPADTHGACMLLRQPTAVATTTAIATFTYTTVAITTITDTTTTTPPRHRHHHYYQLLPPPWSVSNAVWSRVRRYRRGSRAKPERRQNMPNVGNRCERRSNAFRHIEADVLGASCSAVAISIAVVITRSLEWYVKWLRGFSLAACFQIALGANSALGYRHSPLLLPRNR